MLSKSTRRRRASKYTSRDERSDSGSEMFLSENQAEDIRKEEADHAMQYNR